MDAITNANTSANMNPFEGEGMYSGVIESARKIPRKDPVTNEVKDTIRLLVRTSDKVAELNYVHCFCNGEAWEKFMSPRLRRFGITAATYAELKDTDMAAIIGRTAIVSQEPIVVNDVPHIRHSLREITRGQMISVDDATRTARTTYRPLVGRVGLAILEEGDKGKSIVVYADVLGHGVIRAFRSLNGGAGPISIEMLARAGVEVESIDKLTQADVDKIRGMRVIIKRVKADTVVFHDVEDLIPELKEVVAAKA